MKIKIESIADQGLLDKERIVMKVLSDTDVGYYAIFETRRSDRGVTAGVRDAFWFPDKVVSSGDYVVLYSKAGQQSEKTPSGGNKSHFFYWGSDKAKWSSTETAPVLLLVSEWKAYIPQVPA